MVETEPIAVVEENRLSGVTTEDNMVDCAGEMDARFTCHDHIIRENGSKSSLTPMVSNGLVDSSCKCTTAGFAENLMGSPVAEAFSRAVI